MLMHGDTHQKTHSPRQRSYVSTRMMDICFLYLLIYIRTRLPMYVYVYYMNDLLGLMRMCWR